MKKILCLLLVAIMAVTSLVSCGSSLEEGEKGAIIKMGLSTIPDTFDPAAHTISADSAKVYSLIYMTLTTLDSSGKLSKGMAYEWGYKYDEVYNEDKMYFKLYETGWSDGRRVSTSDFIFAWNRILSPESNSPYASLLYPIKNAKLVKLGEMTEDDLGLEAVDDTELEITFEPGYVNGNGKEVANQFATVLANVAFAPLREDKMDEGWTSKFTVASVLSCGPYSLRGYFNSEEEGKIELERNEFYRRDADDKDEALDKFVIPYKIIINYDISNGYLDKASEQFDNGETFYLGAFNKDTYNKYAGKLTTANSLSGYVTYFNTANDVLKDAKVRKALSIALDRNKIAEIVGCGATPATGFVPAGVFETTKGTSFRTGDVYSAGAKTEDAKKLLKEAGVSKGSFVISYVYDNGDDTSKLVAEYAKGVWEALGFKVSLNELKYYTDSDTKAKIYSGVRSVFEKADFDVLLVDFSMNSVDASAYLLPFATDLSGNTVTYNTVDGAEVPTSVHFTGFSDKAYDEIANKVVKTSNLAEKAELLHQLEALIAEKAPVTALCFTSNSYVASSKLSGYGRYYNGAPTFFKVELKGWREIYKQIEAEELAAAEA